MALFYGKIEKRSDNDVKFNAPAVKILGGFR